MYLYMCSRSVYSSGGPHKTAERAAIRAHLLPDCLTSTASDRRTIDDLVHVSEVELRGQRVNVADGLTLEGGDKDEDKDQMSSVTSRSRM